MAHASCINGHSLWDGDGTPCAEAYRLGFFRDLLQREPDCVILHDFSGKYPYIYDCTDGVEGEDLNIWICDDCGSFFIFVNWDKERYDYVPCDANDVSEIDTTGWEEYIVFRDTSDDFERFHDYCEGKSPLDALLTYGFQKRYWLSPDKKVILVKDTSGNATAAYSLARHIDFQNENQ